MEATISGYRGLGFRDFSEFCAKSSPRSPGQDMVQSWVEAKKTTSAIFGCVWGVVRSSL